MDIPIRLTAEQCVGLAWEPYETTEDYRRFRAVYGNGPKGPIYVYRTEIFEGSKFLENVQQERNDNEGRKWSEGMGSDKNGNLPLVKVASVPLNIWMRDHDNGRSADRDYLKWKLNSEDYAPFRTRKGVI